MTPNERFALTRRQLATIILRLNRSRAGTASTGTFLENMSKLLQVLAIVVGGAWVLNDYFEFKKTNNSLANSQLRLAIKTAELALMRTIEERLDVASESSVVRFARFPDQTFLYRFQFSVDAKNISNATVVIPAMVIEFFMGTKVIGNLKPGQAFLINQPSSWLDKAPPGGIKWSRLTAGVQQSPEIEAEIAKQIAQIGDFTPIAGQFVGVIRAGGSSHWNADFVLRAHPEDMAGAVVTFWERGDSRDQLIYTPDLIYTVPDLTYTHSHGLSYTHSRTELLSEAEDALSLKAQHPLTSHGAPRNVQRRTMPH
jgi:hypothetical protein